MRPSGRETNQQRIVKITRNYTKHAEGSVLIETGDTLKLKQTVTDADGDTDSDELDLSSGKFVIEDDGPDAKVTNDIAAAITLDESDVPNPAEDPVINDGIDDGIRTATADYSGNFGGTANIDYGTDGAGKVEYSLELSADNTGSGLYAVDPSNTGAKYGQGAEIELVKDTTTGVVSGMVGTVEYFTISADGSNGKVTFAQKLTDGNNNDISVWHDISGSSATNSSPPNRASMSASRS